MLQFETEMIRQLRPYAIHNMRQFSPVIIGIQKTINIYIEWRLNIDYGLKWLSNEVKYWVVSPDEAIKVLLTTSDNMKEWFRIKAKGAIRTLW